MGRSSFLFSAGGGGGGLYLFVRVSIWLTWVFPRKCLMIAWEILMEDGRGNERRKWREGPGSRKKEIGSFQ